MSKYAQNMTELFNHNYRLKMLVASLVTHLELSTGALRVTLGYLQRNDPTGDHSDIAGNILSNEALIAKAKGAA